MANALRQKNVNELKGYLDKEKIQERFMSLMSKDQANQFMASIINAYSTNSSLQKCKPVSVIGASLQAAALNLPINQNLGFAYMVPYNEKAQFQLG
jgi:recombination protein RecT